MSAATSLAQRLWREPLLRFVLIGAALLLADRALRPAVVATAPSVIVVTPGQQAAQRAAFRSERGRDPQPEESQAQIERWVDEQVLYREALALGLDRRDPIVQRQMTQKMRLLIENAVAVPEPTPAELEAWVQRHPERYGRPAKLSFEQVFLSRGARGPALEDEAAALQRRLAAQPDTFLGLGDPLPGGQVIEAADATRLRRDYGAAFATAIEAAPAGVWHGPIRSGLGLHLVRITGRSAFQPAPLDEVAARARTDWRVDRQEQLSHAQIAALRARYRVEIEPPS